MRRSLTLRLSLISIAWIVLALLLTALILRFLYRQHIEVHYDAHVFSHVEELVAALEKGPGGELYLLRRPTDPRFHREGSGWYWEIRMAGETLERSASLAGRALDLSGLDSYEHQGAQSVTGPDGELLRAHVMEFNYPDLAESAQVVATSPEMQITDDVGQYFVHIMISFLVLGIGLSLAVVFQVHFVLKPLKEIGTAIEKIQSGQLQRLPQDFPKEVQPLADQLNHLLDHEARLVRRARSQLGDLAHAVKNPLTVIRNEARDMPDEKGQLILDQTHMMSSSIDHYLSLARTQGKNPLGFRTRVKPVIEDLTYVVEHVYRERGIGIQLEGLDDCWFRGESQDLEEMAGNLLDNACKWAKHRVCITGQMTGDRLRLTIDDDGPGIPADSREAVLERGRRLDDTAPGSGQGLGIVKDVTSLYGGRLTLSASPDGGLRAELDLPG